MTPSVKSLRIEIKLSSLMYAGTTEVEISGSVQLILRKRSLQVCIVFEIYR